MPLKMLTPSTSLPRTLPARVLTMALAVASASPANAGRTLGERFQSNAAPANRALSLRKVLLDIGSAPKPRVANRFKRAYALGRRSQAMDCEEILGWLGADRTSF